jgi:hypothetical protein
VTTASTVIDNFRYAPIPATTIPANTFFTIAALLPANMQDPWLIGTFTQNHPNIIGPGHGSQLSGATTLSFPSEPGGGMHAIVNASETIVPGSIVPEPATGIFLVTGCGVMLLRRGRIARIPDQLLQVM